MDVVFVAAHDHGCRVAVHADVTGRALERAIAYVRAAFGANATIATTTMPAEVDAELAALETRAGSAAAYREAVEHDATRVRDSHAPEEARVKFYEGLRELLAERAAHAGAPAPGERGSAVSLRRRAGAASRDAMTDPANPMRTGAQILWEALHREGVEVVFGYPGGAIMPAYDAMLE